MKLEYLKRYNNSKLEFIQNKVTSCLWTNVILIQQKSMSSSIVNVKLDQAILYTTTDSNFMFLIYLVMQAHTSLSEVIISSLIPVFSFLIFSINIQYLICSLSYFHQLETSPSKIDFNFKFLGKLFLK